MNNKELHISSYRVSQIDPFGRLKRGAEDDAKELLHKTSEVSSERVTALVEAEKVAWEGFWGKKIHVPNPPGELLDTLDLLEEKSIPLFKPHYLPEMTLSVSTSYPGWKKKPEQLYWDLVDEEMFSDISSFGGHWIIIDSRDKPNVYKQVGEAYPEDEFIGEILKNLRLSKPAKHSYLPPDSRFNLSWKNINEQVLPTIAEALEVESDMVRLPKFNEFNILGNLFYPNWEKTTSRECLYDRSADKLFLITESKSVSALGYDYLKRKDVGFRPMIVFPRK